MLENSYDAKGIRFGIILSPILRTNSKIINNEISFDQLFHMLQQADNMIIDFDQIDGLTVGEVYETSKKNQAEKIIVFVVYHKMGKESQKKFSYIHSLLLIEAKEKLYDIPIDKVIENYYMTNYSEQDEKTKKIINCFLQRYRYGTKERTDEKIKKYTK